MIPTLSGATRTRVADCAVTAGRPFPNPRIIVACELSESIPTAFRGFGLDARQVAGFPDYAVTACGKVFSRKHTSGPRRCFKQLRLTPSPKGYLALTLSNSSGFASRRVHRLVALAFHPNPENLPCVRHKNGVPGDNRATNLAWATYAENEADKLSHGTWHTRVNRKMSKDDRNSARALARKGLAAADIAKEVGFKPATIARLISGKTWKVA